MRKQQVIAIADLRRLAISCRQCGTQVTLDLETSADPAPGGFCPPACPSCHTPYDSAVVPNVIQLRRCYQALRAIGDTVQFHALANDVE